MQCTLYTTSRTVYTQMRRITDHSWSVFTCILINTHTHWTPAWGNAHTWENTHTQREPTSCPATRCCTHSVFVPASQYCMTGVFLENDTIQHTMSAMIRLRVCFESGSRDRYQKMLCAHLNRLQCYQWFTSIFLIALYLLLLMNTVMGYWAFNVALQQTSAASTTASFLLM